MYFRTKFRTTSAKKANEVVPVTKVSQKIVLRDGISFPVHQAFKRAGITAEIEYPISGDNTTVLPGNVVRDFNLMRASIKESKNRDVILTITASEDIIEDAVALIESGGRKLAATKKKTLLPNQRVVTDQPKEEKVISDQFKPVTSGWTIESDTVTIDGQSYKLVPVEDDITDLVAKPKETEEAVEEEPKAEEVVEETTETESKEGAGQRHILRSEEGPDGVVRTEEILEDVEDDKPEVISPVSAVDDDKVSLERIALADLALEIGLINNTEKFAYMADLEALDEREFAQVRKTLESVRQAGLKKEPVSRIAALGVRVPKMGASENGHRVDFDLTDIDVTAALL